MPTAASVVRSLARGTLLRCPECTGPLANGFFDVHDVCPRCGAVLEIARGEFTGAMMLAWGLIGTAALMGYLVLFILEAPLWVQLGWAFGLAIALPLLTYRNMKGFWVGILHATGRVRRPEGPG